VVRITFLRAARHPRHELSVAGQRSAYAEDIVCDRAQTEIGTWRCKRNNSLNIPKRSKENQCHYGVAHQRVPNRSLNTIAIQTHNSPFSIPHSSILNSRHRVSAATAGSPNKEIAP
jgi:hypothetical protein